MRNNLRHFTDIINFRGTRAIAPLHVEYLIRWVAKHGTVFIPSPVVGLLWSPVGVCKYFSRGNPHPRSFMDDVGGSEVEGANACKDRNQTSHSTIDSCINRFCDWKAYYLHSVSHISIKTTAPMESLSIIKKNRRKKFTWTTKMPFMILL